MPGRAMGWMPGFTNSLRKEPGAAMGGSSGASSLGLGAAMRRRALGQLRSRVLSLLS
jgi:hypothetical protein